MLYNLSIFLLKMSVSKAINVNIPPKRSLFSCSLLYIYIYICEQSSLSLFYSTKVMSWSWLHGSWIYNYMCYRCLSPLTLWVRISPIGRCNRYNIIRDKGFQWFAIGRWFSPGPTVSSTNKTRQPRYNWNIVESGVKHHNPNPISLRDSKLYLIK